MTMVSIRSPGAALKGWMYALQRAPVVPDIPSLSLYVHEMTRILARLRSGADLAAAAGRDGGGRRVLVIPGFLATDRMTRRLRATLDAANYTAVEWECGINWGARADLLERLSDRLDEARDGAPIVLVGWSLGGIYARELAKVCPDAVERVITLGTPFSGDPRANRAWRTYEFINRHAVDEPPIEIRRREKPPVPTIALWSRLDGIVAPSSARGEAGEVDRSIEVNCRHIGFVSEHPALVAVLDALEMDV
jgi:pimeloyl-ACP methyl ester carboxylesterase